MALSVGAGRLRLRHPSSTVDCKRFSLVLTVVAPLRRQKAQRVCKQRTPSGSAVAVFASGNYPYPQQSAEAVEHHGGSRWRATEAGRGGSAEGGFGGWAKKNKAGTRGKGGRGGGGN